MEFTIENVFIDAHEEPVAFYGTGSDSEPWEVVEYQRDVSFDVYVDGIPVAWAEWTDFPG